MWGVTEHGTLPKELEQAGCFDGLDLCNIAAVEVGLRRASLIEYAYVQEPKNDKDHKGKGKGGRWQPGLVEEAAVFAGSHREWGDAMIAPDLPDYVAKEVELQRDAAVLKQARKAREERKALREPEK